MSLPGLRVFEGALVASVLLAPSPAAAPPAALLKSGSVELPLTVEIEDGVPVYRKVIVSPTYTVDGIYKSMQGPVSVHDLHLVDTGEPELLWMTGYEAVMVEPDGATAMSQEFMCHSNLIASPYPYARHFPTALGREEVRLFTLAQGQLSIRLPAGFGVPIMSSQRLHLQSQVLNHNVAEKEFETRHRITISFVRATELEKPYIPLFAVPVSGLKLLRGADGYFGVSHDEVDPETHGLSCLPGDAVPESVRFGDRRGRVFSGHWIVKPGREVNHTLVTKSLRLPYDTTIHYVAAHLHPFAEYLELYDLTADRSVFRTRARNTPDRIGLSEVEYISSPEGLRVHKDHEYQVISAYDNTSGVDQDAMATLFLYLRANDLEQQLVTTAH